MNARELGKSGLRVSAIGLGCMGMSHAYGSPADKKEMALLLARAVEMGYTFFDTAEVYGIPEHPHDNEKLLGAALAPYRNKVIIATKFGIRFGRGAGKAGASLIVDSRPEAIRKAVEGSLKRLGVERIDLYYQHRMDPSVPPEEVAGVMSALIREGKIAHWGISEATEEAVRRAHAVCPLAAVQNRYSMMARRCESLFPALEELGIGFVAFSPLANGVLSCRYDQSSTFESGTDYRSVMPQFRAESYEVNKDLFHLLDELAKERQATPAQISLAWMLCKKPWIVPIPGTRKISRLIENGTAARVALSAEEVRRIDESLSSMRMSEVFGGSPIERK